MATIKDFEDLNIWQMARWISNRRTNYPVRDTSSVERNGTKLRKAYRRYTTLDNNVMLNYNHKK